MLLTLVLVLYSFRKLIATVLIGTYIHRVLVIDGTYVPEKKVYSTTDRENFTVKIIPWLRPTMKI